MALDQLVQVRILAAQLTPTPMRSSSVTVRAHYVALCDFVLQALQRAAARQRISTDVEELPDALSVVEIHDVEGVSDPAVGAFPILCLPDYAPDCLPALLVPGSSRHPVCVRVPSVVSSQILSATIPTVGLKTVGASNIPTKSAQGLPLAAPGAELHGRSLFGRTDISRSDGSAMRAATSCSDHCVQASRPGSNPGGPANVKDA